MKRLLFLILLFSLFGITGCSNKNNMPKNEEAAAISTKVEISSEVKKLIPEGYHILQKSDDGQAIAEGNLNGDKFTDVALVIENDKDKDDRSLLIAFGNPDKTFSLSIKADRAIMEIAEGGSFGDPFQGIKVDKGSLLLKFLGGSQRWHQYYRFRYQDDDWYLIGYTEGAYVSVGDTIEVLEKDFDLLTGDYTKDIIEEGKVKRTEDNRGKKQLMRLEDFDAGMTEAAF